MEERKLLGRRIKTLRKSKGYTQEQLAEIIHANVKYLAGIERGEANPTVSLLERISSGLNLPLFELFQYAETGTPPAQLRETLERLVVEAKDEDLPRLTRIFRVLVR